MSGYPRSSLGGSINAANGLAGSKLQLATCAARWLPLPVAADFDRYLVSATRLDGTGKPA